MKICEVRKVDKVVLTLQNNKTLYFDEVNISNNGVLLLKSGTISGTFSELEQLECDIYNIKNGFIKKIQIDFLGIDTDSLEYLTVFIADSPRVTNVNVISNTKANITIKFNNAKLALMN